MYKEPVQEVEFLKGLLAVQVEPKKKLYLIPLEMTNQLLTFNKLNKNTMISK
jgi:hypothetical protein